MCFLTENFNYKGVFSLQLKKYSNRYSTSSNNVPSVCFTAVTNGLGKGFKVGSAMPVLRSFSVGCRTILELKFLLKSICLYNPLLNRNCSKSFYKNSTKAVCLRLGSEIYILPKFVLYPCYSYLNHT